MTIVLLILAVVAVFRPSSVFRYVVASLKKTLREWKVMGKFFGKKKEKKVKATDEKDQPLN